jgi:pyruvate dehydrogenase E1 component beta subunit
MAAAVRPDTTVPPPPASTATSGHGPSEETRMAAPVTMAKALNSGLRAAMERDPKVLVMGEDVGKLGGVFRITDGLQKDFGEQRVLDTPLAESGIIGAAIGLAIRGYRPVCEIQFDGFVFPGFDQIVSQLAKLRYRSQGRVPMPVVVRIPFGGGIGAVEHHSESPESLFAHVPGLKVVACGNPVDAYWMIQQAIETDDPVIFFEPKRRYWDKASFDLSVGPPALFSARVLRPGSTATLVTYGPQVRTCVDAATAASEDGHDLEVIDLRALSPLDLGPVYDSVRRTGHLVVVSEAPSEASVAAEVAARVQQECFYSLEAPVLRVTGFDTPYPPSQVEHEYLPDLDRVLDAVDRSLRF